MDTSIATVRREIGNLSCPARRGSSSDHFPFSIFHFSFSIGLLRREKYHGCQILTTIGGASHVEIELRPNSQARADDLEERLISFAVRIVRLSSRLPRTPAGKHIAGQILRAGTAPAPNYGEDRGAESPADFIHKLGIVLKELNETSIWLRIIEQPALGIPISCQYHAEVSCESSRPR